LAEISHEKAPTNIPAQANPKPLNHLQRMFSMTYNSILHPSVLNKF